MKKLLTISISMILLALNYGCATVGDQYGYTTKELNGWEITDPKNYSSTTYEYKCAGDYYSICPHLYYDTSWIGPVLFPYIFPAFLLEKNKDKNFSGLKIRTYIPKNSKEETENLSPLIKLSNGQLLRPSGCDKWNTYNGIDYKYADCRFDILVWDRTSFSVMIDWTPKCNPAPLEFNQKITGYYMPFPPPHTPIFFSDGTIR